MKALCDGNKVKHKTWAKCKYFQLIEDFILNDGFELVLDLDDYNEYELYTEPKPSKVDYLIFMKESETDEGEFLTLEKFIDRVREHPTRMKISFTKVKVDTIPDGSGQHEFLFEVLGNPVSLKF